MRMVITEDKITRFWKAYRQRLIMFFIIVVVAFLSFGMGYQAGYDSNRTPIIIEKQGAL